MVALWGTGGMGKTTLAVMVARQMYYDFNECVVWINAYEDPEFSLSKMLDLIAARLGRGDLRTYSLEQKKAKVSVLVKRIAPLIILDNFEKLKANKQKECKKWLKEDAACQVLLTRIKRVDENLVLNIHIGKISKPDARKFLDFLRREGDDDE
jgi:CO dehydrogenase nickel-insertion accessory protein CooC1